MPAYFSLTIELYKDRHVISTFCENLVHSGLVFKSGYWGFENDSFDDIITWNQTKLNENFQLGYTEHHSHDYKQMLFDYFEFSEVRLFVMNNRKKNTFSFELIVPEDDLLDYTEENEESYSVQLKPKRMEQLKSIAKKMWVSTDILAIQTGWEASGLPPSAGKIAMGIKPQTEPFCIIHSSSFEKIPVLTYEYMERSGVLIEDITKYDKKVIMFQVVE